ncbi:MAG: hypothetical protein R3301_15065 [Saprospiraceae bacterium]|nr:hypothetical protein [Saprospiraceae bacterium]
MRAKSITAQSPEEVTVALQEAIADGFVPTLGMVFMSIRHGARAISQIFDRQGITWHSRHHSSDFSATESLVVPLAAITNFTTSPAAGWG